MKKKHEFVTADEICLLEQPELSFNGQKKIETESGDLFFVLECKSRELKDKKSISGVVVLEFSKIFNVWTLFWCITTLIWSRSVKITL